MIEMENLQQSIEVVNQEDKRLLDAASNGQTDLVLQLLEENGQKLHSFKDKDGQTALHLASICGQIDTVTALTLNGADVNAQDFTGHTALQRASSEGHLEVTKHLVSRGALIDHQDEVHGNTALHESAWKGFSKTVEFLCKSKSNYYLRNRGGFSPLHLCCQNGHNETCRMLLRAGCKPNIKNNYGDTPLHTAARYGHAGVARILISANSNPDLQNKNGDTPLHIAAAMGRRKLTKILLEAGPDMRVLNQQKETSLDIAKRKNHQEISQILSNPPPPVKVVAGENKIMKKNKNGGIEIVEGVEVIDDHFDLLEHKKSKKHHKNKNNKSKSPLRGKVVQGPVPWSPYGCHYFPDPKEFPDPDPESLPEEPLSNGEQYYLDLAGNIKKGPASNGYTCYCAPLIDRVEKKMDRNKKEMFRHLDLTHGKLSSRISHLEKKTKDQLSGLSNNMKETFAQERLECQDRMERRAMRDMIHMKRQDDLRDMMLRGDLSTWLEKRVADLEQNSAMRNSEDAALMRTLLRSSKRRKKSFLTEIQSGTLRRAASEDYLPGDEAERLCDRKAEHLKNGIVVDEDSSILQSKHDLLHVSDHPHFEGVRVRRNSAGDEMLFCDYGDFNSREIDATNQNNYQMYQNHNQLSKNNFQQEVISYSTNSESQSYSQSDRGSTPSGRKPSPTWSCNLVVPQHLNNLQPWSAGASNPAPIKPALTSLSKEKIYQNFNHNTNHNHNTSSIQRPTPLPSHVQGHYQNQFSYKPPLLPPKHPIPPPYRPPPQDMNNRPPYFINTALVTEPFISPNPMFMGATKTVSDGGGSHDSHNDSGYCTRPGGGSGGPSPSLSGSHGRPDSRGPLELLSDPTIPSLRSIATNNNFNNNNAPSGLSIGPRIREIQNQLTLAKLGAEANLTNESDLSETPRGSLV